MERAEWSSPIQSEPPPTRDPDIMMDDESDEKKVSGGAAVPPAADHDGDAAMTGLGLGADIHATLSLELHTGDAKKALSKHGVKRSAIALLSGEGGSLRTLGTLLALNPQQQMELENLLDATAKNARGIADDGICAFLTPSSQLAHLGSDLPSHENELFVLVETSRPLCTAVVAAMLRAAASKDDERQIDVVALFLYGSSDLASVARVIVDGVQQYLVDAPSNSALTLVLACEPCHGATLFAALMSLHDAHMTDRTGQLSRIKFNLRTPPAVVAEPASARPYVSSASATPTTPSNYDVAVVSDVAGLPQQPVAAHVPLSPSTGSWSPLPASLGGVTAAPVSAAGAALLRSDSEVTRRFPRDAMEAEDKQLWDQLFKDLRAKDKTGFLGDAMLQWLPRIGQRLLEYSAPSDTFAALLADATPESIESRVLASMNSVVVQCSALSNSSEEAVRQLGADSLKKIKLLVWQTQQLINKWTQATEDKFKQPMPLQDPAVGAPGASAASLVPVRVWDPLDPYVQPDLGAANFFKCPSLALAGDQGRQFLVYRAPLSTEAPLRIRFHVATVLTGDLLMRIQSMVYPEVLSSFLVVERSVRLQTNQTQGSVQSVYLHKRDSLTRAIGSLPWTGSAPTGVYDRDNCPDGSVVTFPSHQAVHQGDPVADQRWMRLHSLASLPSIPAFPTELHLEPNALQIIHVAGNTLFSTQLCWIWSSLCGLQTTPRPWRQSVFVHLNRFGLQGLQLDARLLAALPSVVELQYPMDDIWTVESSDAASKRLKALLQQRTASATAASSGAAAPSAAAALPITSSDHQADPLVTVRTDTMWRVKEWLPKLIRKLESFPVVVVQLVTPANGQVLSVSLVCVGSCPSRKEVLLRDLPTFLDEQVSHLLANEQAAPVASAATGSVFRDVRVHPFDNVLASALTSFNRRGEYGYDSESAPRIEESPSFPHMAPMMHLLRMNHAFVKLLKDAARLADPARLESEKALGVGSTFTLYELSRCLTLGIGEGELLHTLPPYEGSRLEHLLPHIDPKGLEHLDARKKLDAPTMWLNAMLQRVLQCQSETRYNAALEPLHLRCAGAGAPATLQLFSVEPGAPVDVIHPPDPAVVAAGNATDEITSEQLLANHFRIQLPGVQLHSLPALLWVSVNRTHSRSAKQQPQPGQATDGPQAMEIEDAASAVASESAAPLEVRVTVTVPAHELIQESISFKSIAALLPSERTPLLHPSLHAGAASCVYDLQSMLVSCSDLSTGEHTGWTVVAKCRDGKWKHVDGEGRSYHLHFDAALPDTPESSISILQLLFRPELADQLYTPTLFGYVRRCSKRETDSEARSADHAHASAREAAAAASPASATVFADAAVPGGKRRRHSIPTVIAEEPAPPLQNDPKTAVS